MENGQLTNVVISNQETKKRESESLQFQIVNENARSIFQLIIQVIGQRDRPGTRACPWSVLDLQEIKTQPTTFGKLVNCGPNSTTTI